MGCFVAKVDFCDWTRNLATNSGRQRGQLLALKSDIPRLEPWPRGILSV